MGYIDDFGSTMIEKGGKIKAKEGNEHESSASIANDDPERRTGLAANCESE